jgi:predicted RNase H-like nuclease
MTPWIAGVDGCPKGWIVAMCDRDAPAAIRFRVAPDFAAILAFEEAPIVIAVDMPIGLPDHVGRNGRIAEQLVRPLLGGLGSSVFPTSVRAVVEAPSYGDAIALARSGLQPFAPSPFANAIVPRIRQIDALLRADASLRRRVYEVHPELAFWTLNGETPLAHRKKTLAGLDQRRALLEGAGVPASVTNAAPPKGAKTDDMLDALAGLVVAREIAAGRGRPYPDPPELDVHGIPAAIWTFDR